MVDSDESIGTSEYLTLQASCRINPGRYNRVRLNFGTGNPPDRLLYIASEICTAASCNLHIIILQNSAVHYAKRQCFSLGFFRILRALGTWLRFTNCCVRHMCLRFLPTPNGKVTFEISYQWCQPSSSTVGRTSYSIFSCTFWHSSFICLCIPEYGKITLFHFWEGS
jgi:hypothetical protein